jgi:hypothetical protein
MKAVSLPAALLAVMLAAAAASSAAADVLGSQPTYGGRALSIVPNAAAMTARIWAPGLDDGFVPQGLTFLDGAVYVGTYRSEDPGQGRGPCRIFRVDPRSGAITGMLDLPPQCGHAGGLARGRSGRLWVADTRAIFEIGVGNPADAVIGRVLATVQLDGDLKGSFAASTADALWLGTYSREPGARLYKLPFKMLAAGPAALSERDATAAIALPTKAQGAAFDPAGRLWVTRSGAVFGELVRIDLETSAVLHRFAMPAGLEDISFEPGGGLWAISEAGSKRWLAWTTFFPVLFRLRPDRLR